MVVNIWVIYVVVFDRLLPLVPVEVLPHPGGELEDVVVPFEQGQDGADLLDLLLPVQQRLEDLGGPGLQAVERGCEDARVLELVLLELGVDVVDGVLATDEPLKVVLHQVPELGRPFR